MATITRRETRKRGFFGVLFKWGFVIINILMMVWLISYWGKIGSLANGQSNEYALAGATIGATIGTGMIAFFWVAGSVILGFLTILTRGKLTIIEERAE